MALVDRGLQPIVAPDAVHGPLADLDPVSLPARVELGFAERPPAAGAGDQGRAQAAHAAPPFRRAAWDNAVTVAPAPREFRGFLASGSASRLES
jgi:hypothetical protein